MNPSDKVICIDDGPCLCCGEAIMGILKGQIYTVESVFEDYALHVGRFTALRLVGIPATTFHRRGIWVRRFRLLSEVQMIVSAVSKNKTTYEPTPMAWPV